MHEHGETGGAWGLILLLISGCICCSPTAGTLSTSGCGRLGTPFRTCVASLQTVERCVSCDLRTGVRSQTSTHQCDDNPANWRCRTTRFQRFHPLLMDALTFIHQVQQPLRSIPHLFSRFGCIRIAARCIERALIRMHFTKMCGLFLILSYVCNLGNSVSLKAGNKSKLRKLQCSPCQQGVLNQGALLHTTHSPENMLSQRAFNLSAPHPTPLNSIQSPVFVFLSETRVFRGNFPTGFTNLPGALVCRVHFHTGCTPRKSVFLFRVHNSARGTLLPVAQHRRWHSPTRCSCHPHAPRQHTGIDPG